MASVYEADPVFEANAKQISNLVARAHERELGLPDFQRDFVWETKRTLELLRSVMCRFPAGTLLFWKQSEANAGFASREIEGAPPLSGKTPDELVLDGQQRLTSLYRALTGAGDEKYFIRFSQFLAESGGAKPIHEVDFDNAIFVVDTTAKLRFDPMDIEWQFENAIFPLSDLANFDEWLDNYARRHSESQEEEDAVKRGAREVRDQYLIPLRSYGFPVVTLPASTPLDAVCNIFETLNRTGKPLGAFELLTARFYPRGVNLRTLWDETKDQWDVLEQFGVEPYDLLQAVSLRARNSAQRADVLSRLTAEEVQENWSAVSAGMAQLINWLRSEHGIIDEKRLPYRMMLVPLAALWQEVQALKPLDRSGALTRAGRFVWATTFTANYDQGANSQAGADYVKLKSWIFDADAEAPEAVASFDFTAEVLATASVRRKALHAGVMALTIKSGAMDFYTGVKLTATSVAEKKVDSHHIFPKGYLSDVGSTTSSELILNRALIDADTNRQIGKKAPSEYLAAMRDTYGEEKVTSVLESHAVEVGSGSGMDEDRYGAFLVQRLELVLQLIEDAVDVQISRSTIGDLLND